jgi:hypothetical protein
MAYLAGDIQVGSYNPKRLSNIGVGHGAIDAGGAYTYLNEKTGWRFPQPWVPLRLFENTSTDYTNGTEAHLDLRAAQFLNEQSFVGVVGYYYQQLTADHGQIAIVGPNASRMRGVGPQIGYNFKVGGPAVRCRPRQ